MKWLFNGIAALTLVAASSVMILTSCGQNYCGFGLIGNCDQMYKDANQQQGGGTGSGGTLVVNPASASDGTICETQKARLTFTGGNGKIYPTGTTDPPNCGTVDMNSWYFTPTTPPYGNCTVYFRDSGTSSVNPQDAKVTVMVKQKGNC